MPCNAVQSHRDSLTASATLCEDANCEHLLLSYFRVVHSVQILAERTYYVDRLSILPSAYEMTVFSDRSSTCIRLSRTRLLQPLPDSSVCESMATGRLRLCTQFGPASHPLADHDLMGNGADCG